MSVFPNIYQKNRTYYAAADGTGSGQSPENPMSLTEAVSIEYGSGDSLLLRRGDVFYGSIALKVNASPDAPFVLGAYGVGARPVISRAKYLEKGWERCSRGFYRFDLTKTGTFGGVQDDGANVGFLEDAQGRKHGVRRKDEDSCQSQYDFYCQDGFLYVRSYIDPFEALGKLTVGNYHDWDALIKISSNTEICDLCLENGGYGITMNQAGARNLYIHDCIIQNIGGTQLGDRGFTKAGNAIELYGSAYNVLIERNIIRNSYDVGFTVQGGGECCWEGITVRNNIFAYNTQSCEVWTDGTDNEQQGVNGLKFIDNLCVCQGEGWGTLARPDRYGGGGQVIMTDILVYSYEASQLNITISGNTFVQPNSVNRIYSVSSSGAIFVDKAYIDGNHLYLADKNAICFSTDNTDSRHGQKYLRFFEWQKQFNHDQNGSCQVLDGDYAELYRLVRTSEDFDDIVRSAQTYGLSLPDNMLGL